MVTNRKPLSAGSFKLVPVSDDDTLLTKEQFDAIIEQGFEDIKNGNGKEYNLEELRVKMGL